jgi:translation elongation factor EF-4
MIKQAVLQEDITTPNCYPHNFRSKYMTEKHTELNITVAQQYLLISMHMCQSLTDETKSVMVYWK